jgi:hypothetical protein
VCGCLALAVGPPLLPPLCCGTTQLLCRLSLRAQRPLWHLHRPPILPLLLSFPARCQASIRSWPACWVGWSACCLCSMLCVFVLALRWWWWLHAVPASPLLGRCCFGPLRLPHAVCHFRMLLLCACGLFSFLVLFCSRRVERSSARCWLYFGSIIEHQTLVSRQVWYYSSSSTSTWSVRSTSSRSNRRDLFTTCDGWLHEHTKVEGVSRPPRHASCVIAGLSPPAANASVARSIGCPSSVCGCAPMVCHSLLLSLLIQPRRRQHWCSEYQGFEPLADWQHAQLRP